MQSHTDLEYRLSLCIFMEVITSVMWNTVCSVTWKR